MKKMTIEEKFEHLRIFVKELSTLQNHNMDSKEICNTLDSFKERAWHVLADVTD